MGVPSDRVMTYEEFNQTFQVLKVTFKYPCHIVLLSITKQELDFIYYPAQSEEEVKNLLMPNNWVKRAKQAEPTDANNRAAEV